MDTIRFQCLDQIFKDLDYSLMEWKKLGLLSAWKEKIKNQYSDFQLLACLFWRMAKFFGKNPGKIGRIFKSYLVCYFGNIEFRSFQ